MNKKVYQRPETEVILPLLAPFQENKTVPVHMSQENDGDIETNMGFFEEEPDGKDPFFED